ncbi:MAG: GNAT family N-acetyltransferase [Ornithinibacter sp.]
MTRRTVDVVPVDGDLTDLMGLWLAAKVDGGMSKQAAARVISDGRLSSALRRPGVQAFLARVDSEPVGYAIASDNPFGVSPTTEIAVEQLWVAPEARRLGVAKALLTSVLAAAEHAGCEHVVSNVPTASRDANRFFARLGFNSMVVRRVVPTTHLRRKLAPETSGSGYELLRRRRSLRRSALPLASRSA